MLITLRRHAPILASLVLTALCGCTILDRPPTLDDGGPSPTEDGRSGPPSDVRVDLSIGDGGNKSDVSGDVSLGDALVTDRAPDGLGPRDGTTDTPTVCVPGATCVPANACHQGEMECGASGATTCRDTSRSQPNGTACDKGVCLDGTCQACAAGTKCDVANKPCRVGTIVCTTGSPVCTESDNKPNGTSCGSGQVCQEGVCKPCVTGDACTPTNACHAGKLDCSGPTPTCTDSGTNVAPGASCGQDKVCDSTGMCVACAQGAACAITGNACRVGTTTCNTGTPVCLESGNTPNGTSCGANKVCSGGACVTCTAGLSCVPANPCHSGTQACSPAVECVDTGSAVMDGTSCGTDQVCSGGMCKPCAAGKSCPTGNACKIGTTSCSSGTSKCEETGNQNDGTSCGMNQVCSKGVCSACTQGASCVPTNACHIGTLDCTSGAPVCNDTGSSLGDGTSCGPDQVCRGGMCYGCVAGDVCQPSDLCKTGAYSCATGSRVCTATGNRSPGDVCDTGKVCNSAGQCAVCADGSACVPTSNRCHKGTLSCASGTGVCNDTGASADNGLECGTNSVCYNGMCNPCRKGTTCSDPNGNKCKNGAYTCDTGQEVCSPTTNKSAGASCGAVKQCVGGVTTQAWVCDGSGGCPTPASNMCTSMSCNSSGTDCLVCGTGQTACNGTCCAAGQGCCNNACTALNTTSNCGVCNNICASGKVCSGTQCLWPDGHVCSSGADCSSGTCGGRCCPAGTSCTCTQPSASNIEPNPGFDTNASEWSVVQGTMSWIAGTFSDGTTKGDADGCPYSGAIDVKCPASDNYTSCFLYGPCISLQAFKSYNFGFRQAWKGGGSGHTCYFLTFTNGTCGGTTTQYGTDPHLGAQWSGFKFGTFNDANISGRAMCEITTAPGTPGELWLDQVYLSAAPGAY